MKIGIVKRVDELGRIVLPKEMRKLLNIREGSRLEISVQDDAIVMKKHSSMNTLNAYADLVVKAISSHVENEVLVTDTDKVIYSNKKRYIDRKLSKVVCDAIYKTDTIIKKECDGSEMIDIFSDGDEKYCCELIVPIVKDGDGLGSIVILATDSKCFKDDAIRVCKAFACFLSEFLM